MEDIVKAMNRAAIWDVVMLQEISNGGEDVRRSQQLGTWWRLERRDEASTRQASSSMQRCEMQYWTFDTRRG